MPTSWTSTCGWCQQTFTANKPRSYCSRPCHDRHKWYGVGSAADGGPRSSGGRHDARRRVPQDEGQGAAIPGGEGTQGRARRLKSEGSA